MESNTDVPYDSESDTRAHIRRVGALLFSLILNLEKRSMNHDASKLELPEKPYFDRLGPSLRNLRYGSEEYKAKLREAKPGIEHHYANNSHHPEYHNPPTDSVVLALKALRDQLGNFDELTDDEKALALSQAQEQLDYEIKYRTAQINGMSLLDLIEMLADWKASSERNADGSIERSIRINIDRFALTPQLANFLINTAREMHWLNENISSQVQPGSH